MNTKPSKGKNSRCLHAISAHFRNSAGAMKMKVFEEKRNPFKNKGVTRILEEEDLTHFNPRELVPEEDREWWHSIFDSEKEAEEWLKNQESINLKGD